MNRVDRIGIQRVIFLLPQALQTRAIDAPRPVRLLAGLDQQRNRHALPNVEHVLIFRTVGAGFPFIRVAVQIQNVNFVERLQQFFPHPAMNQAIQKGIVRDDADDSLADLFHLPMGEAQEFDVIVRQRLDVLLAFHRRFVGVHQRFDERRFIGA